MLSGLEYYAPMGWFWQRKGAWMECEPGQQFTPRWASRCAEKPLETKTPWKLMQARLDDAWMGNRKSLGGRGVKMRINKAP